MYLSLCAVSYCKIVASVCILLIYTDTFSLSNILINVFWHSSVCYSLPTFLFCNCAHTVIWTPSFPSELIKWTQLNSRIFLSLHKYFHFCVQVRWLLLPDRPWGLHQLPLPRRGRMAATGRACPPAGVWEEGPQDLRVLQDGTDPPAPQTLPASHRSVITLHNFRFTLLTWYAIFNILNSFNFKTWRKWPIWKGNTILLALLIPVITP